MFDSARQIECNEFIYSSDEINVQTDVSDDPHTFSTTPDCFIFYLLFLIVQYSLQ